MPLQKTCTIYYQPHKFILSNDVELIPDSSFIIKDADTVFFKEMISGEKKIEGNIFFNCSEQEIFLKSLNNIFTPVFAAGGLVLNTKKELLMILRRGFWDLPKGKSEAGENMEETAIREVCEETGLLNVSIQKHLDTTYHIYSQKNVWYLKSTHWYMMNCSDTNPRLLPQEEEGITTAKWIRNQQIKSMAANSYESIRELLEKYIRETD